MVPISSLGLSWMLCSSLIRSSADLSTPSCLALNSSSCCTRASHNIVMRSSVTSCDNVTDHEHVTRSLITDKYFKMLHKYVLSFTDYLADILHNRNKMKSLKQREWIGAVFHVSPAKSHLVNVALPLVHQGHRGVGGGAHAHFGGGVKSCSEIL